MSIDILFFNSAATTAEEAHESGVTVGFTSDGFQTLINTAMFQLVHEPTPSGLRAINVDFHRPLLKEMFKRYPQESKRNELLEVVERFDWVTGDI